MIKLHRVASLPESFPVFLSEDISIVGGDVQHSTSAQYFGTAQVVSYEIIETLIRSMFSPFN